MIDYLYDAEFWTWTWTPRILAVKSWLIPLTVGLAMWRVRRRDHLRILTFVGYAFMMDYVAANAGTKNLFHPDTNSPWFYLLAPGLFYLMTRFYVDYLRAIGYGWLGWVLPLMFALLVAANALWGDGFYAFPSRVVALYSLTGIVLTVGYFVYLLDTLTVTHLERQPMFWIAAGLLIYFSANFLLWASMRYLVVDKELFNGVYRISHAALILLNGLFTIAVCLKPSAAGGRASGAIGLNTGW